MSRSQRILRRAAVTMTLAATSVAGLSGLSAVPAAAGSLRTCPTSCVAIADANIVEGDIGTRTLSFPITLSRPATSIVTVAYRIQNATATGGTSALAGIDFSDRKSALQTLTFKPSVTTGLTPVAKVVTVAVYPDTLVEGPEALRVTLSKVTGPARLRRPMAVGTIIDDDAGTGIRASVSDASVVEGDTAKTRNLVFRVTLSSAATSEVVLNYVVSPGSATYSSTSTGGGDFGGKLSNTLKFVPAVATGKTPVLKAITIPVWADTLLEADDTIIVTLSAASLPAGVSFGRVSGTGSIGDDDAPATTVAVPNSMASLGDSMSRGFNACSNFGECTTAVWSTGADGGVNSHYTRILAINPAIAGNNHNDAVSGAVMAHLNGQAVNAVNQNVDYVTIEMGGNDACKATEAQMTSAAAYHLQFLQAMTTLTNGLPNARILVASVPDLLQLWAVGKDVAAARSTWSTFSVCQSMVANPQSTAPADVDRRTRVRQRVIDYNTALATVCAQFTNCTFDQNAVFNSPFALTDVSPADYFHPSYAGQTGLAVSTYAAGFDW